MTPVEIPLFIGSVTQLAEALGAKVPTQSGFKVWIQVLREFPLNEIVDQLDGWAKRSNKMPAPSDVWKVCNDRRTDRIEVAAIAEKQQFGEEAKRAFRRSDAFGQKLRTLSKRLSETEATDPKDWARIIHHRFINNLPANDGQAITAVQIRMACTALNLNLPDAYADRDSLIAA